MPRTWYNATETDESIDINIYGPIGKSWYDDTAVSAKQLLDKLQANPDKAINLHVNSEGGSVFDAFAMYSQLKEHKGKVTAHIDGLAASAASYLIAAADEVHMSDVAWMMIHNASTFSFGNKNDLRKDADICENIDNTIASIYAKRSSYSQDHFLNLMEKETWLSAQDAAELGLVDVVSEGAAIAARLDFHNFIALNNAPEEAQRAILGACIANKQKDKSDTCEIINEDNDNEEGQETEPVDQAQERSFVVIGNRVFNDWSKNDSRTTQSPA